MRCQHVLRTGNRCGNVTWDPAGYCHLHEALHPRVARTERGSARPRPVPTGPVVSPDVIAIIISHTQVPPSYRRMFLTEFCEAFTEHDGTFDAEAFLSAADVITVRKDVV